MKAILQFNLPEEAVEHELALKGSKLAGAVYEFLISDLRATIKYGGSDVEVSFAELWRDKLIERLKEAGVLEMVLD